MSKFLHFLKQNPSPYDKSHTLTRLWHEKKTSLWYHIFLKECGKHNIILPPLYITPENVILENNVLIWQNARIEGVKTYEGVKYDPIIIFRNNVSVQQNLHLTCATKIEIGKNTAIAANVSITDINHPYDDIQKPIEKQPITTMSVCIGEDCKIYNNTVILPGVTIGKHCIIGANSVVKGNFPDYSVIVGAPAKIVKRFSFEKRAWLKTTSDGSFIEI